jgi:hypothetical protein
LIEAELGLAGFQFLQVGIPEKSDQPGSLI